MPLQTVLFHFAVLLLSAFHTNGVTMANQSLFFSLSKSFLSGRFLSEWDVSGSKPLCNFTGIRCNNQGYVEEIDITGRLLSGQFPDNVCSYLPELRVLRLGQNDFHGSFPRGINNCSLLEELNMSATYLTGTLPDVTPMKSLRVLDLSYNLFTGDFPFSVTNLTNLELLNFNENGGLNLWKLPESISRLTKLKSLVLSTCMLKGSIPPSIGNMSSLVDLEFSGNFMVGKIPTELGRLRNLRQLELYYNEFTGEIPEELGNLTELEDLDMSVNKFTGKIPDSIYRLPKLGVLQLYNNSLSGQIPEVIGNSTYLTLFSLYANQLTGEIPQNLGRSSPMVLLDLSENHLTGKIPAEVCNGGRLVFFLLLSNMLTGKLPKSYEKCATILRFRVSSNNLEGTIPEGLFSLPHVSIIDLSYNRLYGPLPKTIGHGKNLSELFLQNNKISGILPTEISQGISLVKIDLSNNLLTGPIPFDIGSLKRLNMLQLQGNELDSSIPNSLSSLKLLNVLDLSRNQLTGQVPESLTELLPNSMNFSNNFLSGPIPLAFAKGGLLESFSNNPDLCIPATFSSSSPNFHRCSQPYIRKKVNCVWLIGISVGILMVGAILFLRRWFSKKRTAMEQDDNLSSSFFSYDMKSFHRVSFDHREIVESMVDKNIVGYGGSGTVYRIELSSGEVVAVKKMSSRKDKYFVSKDELFLDKELKTEVETLGSIRHKNIVKLYCYFSSLDCSLLVYEYMPSGNLWDALHGGKCSLDWPTRYRIALGVAQGLAYLHHDLMPPIIHRDIKSTNILLDINYYPKVADFGIAKVLQARGGKDSTTTVVGTYGYLAPEYAYSSKATMKCDVYSFGVVLMELITGKKPVEAEFGENKNIIYWVLTKLESKEGAIEVLDKGIYGSFREEMVKVLRTAIRCTSKTPAQRPTMDEVVQSLIEADPCRFGSFKSSSNKSKEKLDIK